MKSKGTYYELKSKELLEKQGFKVERALAKVIWINGKPISKHHDFFGLFDLIAIKKEKILLIQVKFLSQDSHGWLAEIKRNLEAFEAPEGSKQIHLWRKKEKKSILEVIQL